MKFKVGDKVRFIGDATTHSCTGEDLKADIKKYNNIFTIGYISNSYVEFEENRIWCIEVYEIELIQENQFTKADLKDGDIVTYRNGRKRTVIAKNLINDNGCIAKKIDNYTEELKDTISGINLDIVKVERPVKYETLFERKEEILDETEKRYLANVIKPFRHNIKTIEKTIQIGDSSLCYLNILLKNNDMACLPNFKKNSMYKGMIEDKEYTLKELGI